MKNLKKFDLNEEARILAHAKGSSDIVDKIMRYEGDEMSDEETVKFFQELIDTGLAWSLQGAYGRMATALIKSGACHAKAGGKKSSTEEQH